MPYMFNINTITQYILISYVNLVSGISTTTLDSAAQVTKPRRHSRLSKGSFLGPHMFPLLGDRVLIVCEIKFRTKHISAEAIVLGSRSICR